MADAVIAINLRESREKAFKALIELQNESLGRGLLLALFAKTSGISSETLRNVLSHRNAQIRKGALKLLSKRRELTLEDAGKLLADPNGSIRLDAIFASMKLGKAFSTNEARQILVKPQPGILFGSSDREGEKNLERFRERTLASLSKSALDDLVKDISIFDMSAYFARARMHFGAYGADLRKVIADRFKDFFESHIEKMSKVSSSDTIQKTRSIEDRMRKELTRKAVDVLCSKFHASDLALVRSVLQSDFIDYSACDIEYLKKFGEWDDIPLVIAIAKKPDYSRGLLMSEDDRVARAADAIYHIGKNRIVEILQMDIPGDILSKIVAIISQVSFGRLEDSVVLQLLVSENDSVRKNSALKCVQSFSKDRLRTILASYMNPDERRFYNVIYWLDFGVSSTKEISARVAGNIFSEILAPDLD
ncbi:MAG: hypothetical protein V4458_09485 [Pseudomonadota bacterium]|nr:hypothetical protein [Afipia sp.]